MRVRSTQERRSGFVLLAVLVVVVLLTLAAYQYNELMLAEYQAAQSYSRATQAKALASSGVHYAAALLSDPTSFTTTLNSNPFDNPQYFQAQLVQPNDSPRFQGRFSVIAIPAPDASIPGGVSQAYRYGVIDECGKINLNALFKLDSSGKIAHDVLMMLPNMTEDIANSILDWIDPDEEPRANGAENEYYQTLSPPYSCKNGPLDSLEELLLVKGVTPQLLLGNDTNRNGVLDANEDDGTGAVDQGWSAYLTVHSREQNLDAQGNPRIYVNGNDLNSVYTQLNTALGEDLANYIVAYRLYGASTGQTSRNTAPSTPTTPTKTDADASRDASSNNKTGSTPTSSTGASSGSANAVNASSKLARQNLGNLTRGRPQSISSLYQLVNSKVSIPGSNAQAPATIYPSPLNDSGMLKQLLPLLLDKVTTVRDTEIPSRVNINTAPSVVLAALPGLSDADVQNILDHRPSLSATDPPDPIFQTPAWMITEANFNANTLQTLEKYITARSQVYRVQSLGYFDGGGPTAHIEAVIDTNAGQPRIIYWRDLTELGKGFDLQQ